MTDLSQQHENRIEAMHPGKRFLLFTVLFVIAALVLLAVAEIGVRTRMYIKYGTFMGFEMKTLDPESGLKIPRPNSVNGPIVINSLGFRSPELEEKNPDEVVRFAFLGASTTFCQEVSSNDRVWPDLLTSELRKTYKSTPIDYLNASATAYTLSDSLVNLQKRVAHHSPDIIFIYHAVNDIGENAYMQAVDKGIEFSSYPTNPWYKKLIETSLLAELIHKNLIIIKLEKQSDISSKKIKLDLHATSQGFKRDLGLLIEEALEIAELVIIPVFVNHLRPDQTPEKRTIAMTTHTFNFPYLTEDDLIAAFESFNRVIREFAELDNVIVIETEAAIEATPENFIDSVHFTDKGSERMAKHLATELVAIPRFNTVVEQLSPQQ